MNTRTFVKCSQYSLQNKNALGNLIPILTIFNYYWDPFSSDGGVGGEEEDETTGRVGEDLAREVCRGFPLVIVRNST